MESRSSLGSVQVTILGVMNLEANKGNGLAKIQEYLNITKEETMAFGDNINDLEMLGNAAYSYAVGDAREEVRQAAALQHHQ